MRRRNFSRHCLPTESRTLNPLRQSLAALVPLLLSLHEGVNSLLFPLGLIFAVLSLSTQKTAVLHRLPFFLRCLMLSLAQKMLGYNVMYHGVGRQPRVRVGAGEGTASGETID